MKLNLVINACFNQSAINSAHQTIPQVYEKSYIILVSIPCNKFNKNINTKNNTNVNLSHISLVTILNKFFLLYFLKTVDLISAKLPPISNPSKAWSEEFTATFSVAICTNNNNEWIVVYTKTTMILMYNL